jgi:hypothetical protein
MFGGINARQQCKISVDYDLMDIIVRDAALWASDDLEEQHTTYASGLFVGVRRNVGPIARALACWGSISDPRPSTLTKKSRSWECA